MAQQPSRRHIAVSVRDHERATALRDALAERSGRKVTISGTVGRALECLEDSHLYQRSLIRTHAPICACRGT